jgi:hypothetical protein
MISCAFGMCCESVNELIVGTITSLFLSSAKPDARDCSKYEATPASRCKRWFQDCGAWNRQLLNAEKIGVLC